MEHLARSHLAIANIVESTDRVVDDGALTHPVNAAEDIHIGLKLPHDVPAASPQRLNLYSADIFCLLTHSLIVFDLSFTKLAFFSHTARKKHIYLIIQVILLIDYVESAAAFKQTPIVLLQRFVDFTPIQQKNLWIIRI
jgi:hypothetical protein